MPVLFEATHETGDLSEYDSYVTGSQVTVNASAAMAGTSLGKEMALTNTSYGIKSFVSTGEQLHVRFYINRDNETQANGEEYRSVLQFSNNDQILFMLGTNGSGKYGRLALKNDGRTSTSWGVQTAWNAGAQYVEIVIYKADTDSSADAYGEWYSNGVLMERSPASGGIDLYDDWPDEINFGTLYPDASTSGPLYLDQLKIADDNAMIGPHSANTSGYRSRYDLSGHRDFRGRYAV